MSTLGFRALWVQDHAFIPGHLASPSFPSRSRQREEPAFLASGFILGGVRRSTEDRGGGRRLRAADVAHMAAESTAGHVWIFMWVTL